MSVAFGSGYLQNGNTGNYVRNVQWFLHWEGLLDDNDIDGIFGPITDSAVRDYQLKYWYDLTDDENENVVDGIVGPKQSRACGPEGEATSNYMESNNRLKSNHLQQARQLEPVGFI